MLFACLPLLLPIHIHIPCNVYRQRASSPNRFHAKEPLSEGGRYRMTLDADQKLYHMAKLEITQVVTGDRGEYRALARNKHGEGVATINLNFEGSGKPK